MKTKIFSTIIVMVIASSSFACGGYWSMTPHSEMQVALYRAAGLPGVDKFIQDFDTQLNDADPGVAAEWHATLDKIAGQKDSYYSRLFWFDNLEDAQSMSEESGKPILYLRMLGKLTEDLSCANSRLFRTTLYTDPKVQTAMRDDYVLCWGSERPVPQVTIDFGDGRQMKTTITGNSIHYILDSDGTPIDAIPGLNSAPYFEDELDQAVELYNSIQDIAVEERGKAVRDYHQKQVEEIAQWGANNWIMVGVNPMPTLDLSLISPQMLTVGKGGYEMPMISMLDPWSYAQSSEVLDKGRWYSVAEASQYAPEFSANAQQLIRTKNPEKYEEEEKWNALVTNLVYNMAVETARNRASSEYVLHTWFADEEQSKDLETFNKRVYDELFITPQSDQWLGLTSNEIYSALDNDGIVKSD